MLFPDLPARRTYDRIPDRATLGAPLRTPDGMTTPLRPEQREGRMTLTWRMPWVPLVTTFVLSFGSITGGLFWAMSADRIDTTTAWVLLAVVWGTLLPFACWIFYRACRHAVVQPRLLEADTSAAALRVGCVDGEVVEATFAEVQAVLQVSRMVQEGQGGGRRSRLDAFSLLVGPESGPWTQVALFSLHDTGKRAVELRSFVNDLPRALGCKRVRIAFDRNDKLQEPRAGDS